jgi:hypothetical protein
MPKKETEIKMEQQVRKDVTWRKGRCGSSGKTEIMEKLDVRCTTCCSCGWGETMSTELSHHWAYCLSPQVVYEYGYSQMIYEYGE